MLRKQAKLARGTPRRQAQTAVAGPAICYYCDEGFCAHCNGWHTTISEGRVLHLPCEHDCRAPEQKKPNQRSLSSNRRPIRRA